MLYEEEGHIEILETTVKKKDTIYEKRIAYHKYFNKYFH